MALFEPLPLPFELLPPCGPDDIAHCMPADTHSNRWTLPLQLARPNVSEAQLLHVCGPLVMHNVQPAAVRQALSNATFWSGWLGTRRDATARRRERDRLRGFANSSFKEQQCVSRLRGWNARICQLENVYIEGAAQVIFNRSAYFGPYHRVTSTLKPEGGRIGRDFLPPHVNKVEGHLPHAVLTHNEYGAGFYHILFDTLASLSYLWPVIREDDTARVLLNPCTVGRDHLQGKYRTLAPSLKSSQQCKRRSHAAALLDAIGIKYFSWPYTRQPRGPILGAAKVTFMCSHPFHSTHHRNFWYVQRLRSWIIDTFQLSPQGTSRTHVSNGLNSYPAGSILLIDRTNCIKDSAPCDNSRAVLNHDSILRELRQSFAHETVNVFTGSEPFASQLKAFSQAKVIIGPHGAAFANSLVCPPGTAIVEFHRLTWQGKYEANSPLYVILSRMLQLRHWVVVDTVTTSSKGYYLFPSDVVTTTRMALQTLETKGPSGIESSLIEYPNWIFSK